MYNAKNDIEYNSKKQIPYYVEDRKYYNHETIHNSGVGYYSNVHNKIFRNY